MSNYHLTIIAGSSGILLGVVLMSQEIPIIMSFIPAVILLCCCYIAFTED